MLNYPVVAGIFACSESTNQGTQGFSNQISKAGVSSGFALRNFAYRAKFRAEDSLFGLPRITNAAIEQATKQKAEKPATPSADAFMAFKRDMIEGLYKPLSVSDSIRLGRGLQRLLAHQKVETRLASAKAGKKLKRKTLQLDGSAEITRITMRLQAAVVPCMLLEATKIALRMASGYAEAMSEYYEMTEQFVQEWDPNGVLGLDEFIQTKLEKSASAVIDSANGVETLPGTAVANIIFRGREAKGKFLLDTTAVFEEVKEFYISRKLAVPQYWTAMPEKTKRARKDQTRQEAAQASRQVEVSRSEAALAVEIVEEQYPHIVKLYRAYAMSRKLSLDAPMDGSETSFAEVLECEARDESLVVAHEMSRWFVELRETPAFTPVVGDPERTTQRLWTVLRNKHTEDEKILPTMINAFEDAMESPIPAMFDAWCVMTGIDPRDGRILATGAIRLRELQRAQDTQD